MQKIQDVASECWEGMSIFEEEQQQLPQMRNWLWTIYGRTIAHTASCCPSAEASTWFWLCGRQPGTVGTMQRPRALLKAWDAVSPDPISYQLEDKPVFIRQRKRNGSVSPGDMKLNFRGWLAATPQGFQLKAWKTEVRKAARVGFGHLLSKKFDLQVTVYRSLIYRLQVQKAS